MNARRTTAQVATEAIVNHAGDGYDAATVAAVRAEAIEAGVAQFYIDLLAEAVVDPPASDVCAHEPNGWACARYVGCPAW